METKEKKNDKVREEKELKELKTGTIKGLRTNCITGQTKEVKLKYRIYSKNNKQIFKLYNGKKQKIPTKIIIEWKNMSSPEVEIDIEGMEKDYSGAVVTIEYPQKDGTTKKFEYDIPESIMQECIKQRKIEPIVEYLSDYISKIQYKNLIRSGAKLRSETLEKYKLNQYGIIKRGLTESIIENILTEKEEQKMLSEYFNIENMKTEKSEIENYIKDIHTEIIEFLGENKEELENLHYTIYNQRKKGEKENSEVSPLDLMFFDSTLL